MDKLPKTKHDSVVRFTFGRVGFVLSCIAIAKTVSPQVEDLALLVKLEAHHIYVVGKMLKQLFNFKVNLKLGHKWLWLVLLESRSVACFTLILFDCSWQIRPETTSKPTASLFWGGCQLCYIALEICFKSTLFLCRNSEAGQRRHVR